MRKYFVTGFYLIIVGGLLLLGGILMGANRSVVWDHGFKVSPLTLYPGTCDLSPSIRIL